jgi:YfiH family protein
MSEPAPPRRHCLTLAIREREREQFRESHLKADWPAPPQVHAFATLRSPAGHSKPPFDTLNLGVRGGDLVATMENRSDLGFYLELPSPPHWLQQVHGSDVIALERPAPQFPFRSNVGADYFAALLRAEPIADAAVTSTSGVVLAILTADCMPVLFCSEDGDEVGAAHAGWRGLAAGVLERTVAAMRTPPEKLLAWLGPAAGPEAYEVGDEVRSAFVDIDPRAASAFSATRPVHWLCDLYALARLRLASIGVSRVFGGGECTISDPQRFFSYRRDSCTGRMASLIWINSAVATS